MSKLYDVAKAVLERKCIDLNTSTTKLEKMKMNNELSNQLNMSGALSEGRNWRKTTNQA